MSRFGAAAAAQIRARHRIRTGVGFRSRCEIGEILAL
jgi:hypothetical protein